MMETVPEGQEGFGPCPPQGEKSMWQALFETARRFIGHLCRAVFSDKISPVEPNPLALPKRYHRLEKVRLTDEVCRTLFDEFHNHRQSDRGTEEIGWVLLGVREEKEALVLATLPAGASRSAGVAHVRFNSSGQALASRIVRQWDRRLVMLGVVHTHPGSLRHPSEGDFQGDSAWVGQLRGSEGIFGIGTADAKRKKSTIVAERPEENRQIFAELCFCWYGLRDGDRRYRKLPLEVTLGPDLAKELHPVWDVIEDHAESLDRLCRQQAGVIFEIGTGGRGPSLVARLHLAQKGSLLRIVLERENVQYFFEQDGKVSTVDPDENSVDRAVYLILAELATTNRPRTAGTNHVSPRTAS